MRVKLESVGNPDYRQDPEKPLWGAEPNRIASGASFLFSDFKISLVISWGDFAAILFSFYIVIEKN